MNPPQKFWISAGLGAGLIAGVHAVALGGGTPVIMWLASAVACGYMALVLRGE